MFTCRGCGEICPAYDKSNSPGMCRDCYAIMDMDRFREYDTGQLPKADTLHSCRELDPVTGKWIPLRKTSPLSLAQWRQILDTVGTLEDEEVLPLADQGRRIQELEPLVSQSSADTVDK